MKIAATTRTLQGTGASRRLRIANRVPGIVYGGTSAAAAIDLDHNTLYHALKKEAFHASILEMDLDGKAEKVLLRDVQMHPFRQIVLHVDFQRVLADQKIHMKVPLHFVNAENSPAVKLSSAVISHVMTEIDITCLPADLPEFITVDLANATVGHSIHVKDLTLPKGVSVVDHSRGKSNPVVASITVPAGAVADEAAPAAPVAAAAVPTKADEKAAAKVDAKAPAKK